MPRLNDLPGRARAGRLLASVTAATLLLAAAGCGDDSSGPASSDAASNVSAKDFDPSRFDDSTNVDNEWLPLEPGTQLAYEGSAIVDEKKREPHRVVFTVTDLVKEVAGVPSVVVWDRDYSSGELVEAELAFFAQDEDGNVWQMGQYPEEYENGKVVETPTWFEGVKGARAGIAIRAEPEVGSSSYEQGYAPPPVEYLDNGRVYRTGESTCVPVDCYDDVLITEEFEPGKPGEFQLKYYASGVGNVRVGWRGRNEDEREVLKLVALNHLDDQELAQAGEAALDLERSAYKISEDVYGKTPPIEAQTAN
jgi:hypothetical protein